MDKSRVSLRGAKGGPRTRGDNARWWKADEESVGGQVTALAATLEAQDWNGSRYAEYVCARLLTGRANPGGFAYSMQLRSGRNAAAMSTALYNPPALNTIAIAGDVFINKVFKNRPWLIYTPTVMGDTRLREKCKYRGLYVDAAFDELKIWDKVMLACIDSLQYPSGFLKIHSGFDGKTLTVDRVLSSEILLTPEETGSYLEQPGSLIQRVFAAREDLIACYGDNGAAVQAINNAPGVYSGLGSSQAQYSEIVALCEAWRLPLANGQSGRHVLAVGNYTLCDEPWTRDGYPFAKYEFNKLSSSWKGQSMAEVMLPLQQRINTQTVNIVEAEDRNAWPRWAIESSSDVNPDEFAGPGFVTYTGQAPLPLPIELSEDLYKSLANNIAANFQRVGIGQSQAEGDKPQGLSSGLALLSWQNIQDARHVDLSQRLEDFVEDVGDLILLEAAELKPKFSADGHQLIKWDDVDIADDKFHVSAMPLSKLSQSAAARYQQIQNWYDEGTITRAQKMRLEDLPDTQGFVRLDTASDNWVAKALDDMVEQGKYVPPLPYIDTKAALRDAQARFILESNWNTPKEKLRLINKFISALNQMPKNEINVPAGTTPPPGAAPVGAPSPQGAPAPGAAPSGMPAPPA